MSEKKFDPGTSTIVLLMLFTEKDPKLRLVILHERSRESVIPTWYWSISLSYGDMFAYSLEKNTLAELEEVVGKDPIVKAILSGDQKMRFGLEP